MAVFFVICAALLLAAAVLRYCFNYVFVVKKSATSNPCVLPSGEQYARDADKILSLIRAAQAMPCEEVSIRSHDGLKLVGRYYETAPGAPVQILFHGYRSNPFRDFCGGLPLALKSGCNVLLVSQRAHEKSEGRCLSFGILERQDCLRWVEYVNGRFGPQTPVFLVGISMGAATVMMASELALPKNVVGILADCGYSTPKKIIQKVIADSHYPSTLLYPLVRLAGRIFGGFDLDSASSVEALTHCQVPVLFIHGDGDDFVPWDMSRECYAACASKKRLVTVPNAGHAVSYIVDEAAYTEAVQNFLKECLQ